MKRLLVLSVVAFLAAYFIPTSVVAQTQFATISGTVTDEQGLAVPDVSVTVTSVATGTKQVSTTNKDGLYVVANVLAGEYDITVEKQGFQKVVKRVTVAVAQALTSNFTLKVGQITQTLTVTESAVAINTESGELSREITQENLKSLPLLTRNPYDLIGLSAGASDTGSVTGDTRGGNAATGEGLGFAVNGHRTSDLNFMLDGGENNDTFIAGVAELVPLEAVQEFKIQANDFSASQGRSPVNVNVVTRSGTNSLHATAWEYYRGSGLSSAPFSENATGRNPDGSRVTPKSRFNRNDFGFVAGGPIRKSKTFAFGSFEGVRIRSSASTPFLVPTSTFVSDSTAAASNFITAFGGLPASNCAIAAESAMHIYDTIEGNAGTAHAYGMADTANPGNVFGLFPGGTALHGAIGGPQSGPAASLIPAATNLFCGTSVKAPLDNGGGLPQNTWRFTGRIDHHFSDQTTLTGRYAYENAVLPVGSVSFSPYAGFNTAQRARDQNLALSLAHSFSSRFFSDSRFVYNRVFLLQPEGGPGQAPTTTPCWQYTNGFSSSSGFEFTFPGFVPAGCAGLGIPFGGPQNIYQANENMTYLLGKHTFKFGGGYFHMRDNRTFGAYENGFELSSTMQNMLNGIVDQEVATAIDPKGLVPGNRYCLSNTPCTVGTTTIPPNGPLGPPTFTRHFHYNEVATYFEDSYKIHPRVTVNLGMRWEYFGVQHSPQAEKLLDANFLFGAVGSAQANQDPFVRVANGRFQRVNNFYQQDWKDWGPRAGVAYDIFGNGRTVLRGGYGIFYARNFGNATFNAIQNPPNYNVVAIVPTDFVPGGLTIDPNQFTTLAGLAGAGGSFAIGGSARMLDRNLKTAYTEQWNVTLEHDILGKGIVGSLSYVGTNGLRLYVNNNLNQRGACVRLTTAAEQAALINGCSPGGGSTTSRINQTGVTGLNRRGNEGLSRYNALQFDLRTRQIGSTGLTVNANYTWAHSIDNSSSFFTDSAIDTIPFFNVGFRDAFHPALDRASSANDIRHRFTANATWAIPYGKNFRGIAGQVFGGWTLSSIFTAETGGAFSVQDGSGASQCRSDGVNFCYPVLTGPIDQKASPASTPVPGVPNTFALYTINNLQNQDAFCASPNITGLTGRACTGVLYQLFPTLLSGPHMFRTPGIYDWDGAVLKDFKLPREGMGVQFRAEFFNLLNHSNLYVVPGSNVFTGAGTVVNGVRGCFPGTAGTCASGKERRNVQLALKFSF